MHYEVKRYKNLEKQIAHMLFDKIAKCQQNHYSISDKTF